LLYLHFGQGGSQKSFAVGFAADIANMALNNFAFHPLIFHFGQIDSAFALDPADETHSDNNVH
jgi:hypothetical protein